MHVKRYRLSRFENRSLALFASLALSSGMAAAQFTVGPAAPVKPATTAAAPSMQTQIADEFRKTDADGDGSISRKEAAQWKGLSRNFDKADSNRDGALSRPEFDKAVK